MKSDEETLGMMSNVAPDRLACGSKCAAHDGPY